MLSNEQKAHDLAVSLMPWRLEQMQKNMKKEDMTMNPDGTYTMQINVYAIYRQNYDNFLAALNKDFPDGANAD